MTERTLRQCDVLLPAPEEARLALADFAHAEVPE